MDDGSIGLSLEGYQSKEEQWDKLASMRGKPRRLLPEGELVGHLYPPIKQPLCEHPLVKALGPEAMRQLLIQSAYKFMSDVAYVETETVNHTTLKIAHNRTPIEFPDDIRHDALSVVVDEAYHAYVAEDYLRQVRQRTGIQPLYKNPETSLAQSIAFGKSRLPSELHELFELVAICIGENTLTKELLMLTGDKSVHPFIHEIMTDHVRDEGRHCTLFALILKSVWSRMDGRARDTIGELLPEFIREYLKPDLQARYDRQVLAWLNVPAVQIDQILADTHVEPPLEQYRARNPISGHVVNLLKQCEVLAHEKTAAAFRRWKLLA